MTIAQGINSGQIADAGIVVGDLADGALAASVAGRLKMATGYFDTAAVLDKFAANSFTNANLLSLVLDGAFQADAATRALFGAGIWNTASLSAGVLSADVTGRALTAASYFDTATVLDKFAAGSLTSANLTALIPDDALTNAILLDLVQDGAFAATAATRALFAALFVNDAMINDVAAAKVTGQVAIANGGTASATAADARTALGLVIGTNVQAFDATLFSIAALGTAADRLAYTTGIDTWAETPLTAAGRALIDDASAAAQRTTLGLDIGVNVQAFDATLLSLAALGTAADRLAYTTAIDIWAETPLTAAGRALIDDASAAAQRTTLGLDIGTDVQAFDATLFSIAALGTIADRIVYTTGIDTWAEATLAAGGRNLIALAANSLTADATGRALFAAGIFNQATVDSAFGTGSIGEDRLTAREVDQRALAAIADTAVGAISSLGADVVMKLTQPDGVTADLDFTAPAALGNFEIIDAWVRPTNVNGANANSTQLQTAAAAAITDVISTNGVADGGIVRATLMNEANAVIASGGTIRVRRVKAGGLVNADVFVRVIKRA